MSIAVELRRTKTKYSVLMNTPYIAWVMGDIIDMLMEQEGYSYDTIEKNSMIGKLKEKYERFIREHEEGGAEQIRLHI